MIEHLHRQGSRLLTGLRQAVAAYGLDAFVQIEGRPCSLWFVARDHEGQRSQAFRTLLLQETIKRGVIMPSLVVSYAHTDDDIDRTVEAVDHVLTIYRMALDQGIDDYLVGRPSAVVYRRRN